MKHLELNTRQLIADEAARLLHEEGYRDYLVAKNKAAQRLGVSNRKQAQPSNIEIHDALVARINLYSSAEEIEHLKQQRIITLEAMDFLQAFKPMLVGPVLTGTAGMHSPITLHLFPDVSEEVIMFLDEGKIPFQIHERKHHIKDKSVYVPMLRFYVDDEEVELVLFDEEHRSPPRCPVFGKSMQRATTEEVKQLL